MKDNKDSVNINAGHRKRLRERFLRGGIKAFAPHEIIELILTFAIPQKDVKPLAKMLIDRFGSVSGVLNAPAKLLMEQPGIKENSEYMVIYLQHHTPLVLCKAEIDGGCDALRDFLQKQTGLELRSLG